MANPEGKEEGGFLEWLYSVGEEKLTQMFREALSHPRLSESLSKALEQAARAKGQMDQNVGAILSFLNLPSKRDYQQLLAKVEAVQGSLVNLNIKVDRLMEEQKKKKGLPRRSSRPSGKPPGVNPRA